MQTEALLEGRLHLNIEPHPALATLENPYLGDQNRPYRILDLSYYRGYYYSYFGLGPIVVLTAPWRLLTGEFLTEPGATWIFLVAHAVVVALLLRWLVRRHFDLGAGTEMLAYAFLVFAPCTGVLLQGVNPGTVAQSGAYFFLTLGLYAGARTAAAGPGAIRWLVLAATCCGGAIACRPSFAPGMLLLAPALLALISRNGNWRQAWRPWVAAGAPLTVIAVVLMIYNRARFDSLFEFGNRLQLTDHDYRTMRMFGGDFFAAHAGPFWVEPLKFITVFPFILHRGAGLPAGLLWICPASVLALGWWSLRRRPGAGSEWWHLLGFPLVFAGIWLFLSCYRLFLFHYQIDFMVPWVWVVVVGWFAATQRVVPLATGRLFRFAAHSLVVASILAGMAYPAAVRGPAGQDSWMARTANRMAYACFALLGQDYGALRLEVTPPHTPPEAGELWPLLSTGNEQQDVVYLEALENGKARITFFHTGAGSRRGQPFSIAPGRSFEVTLHLGSLLPEDDHPNFAHWSPAERFTARHRLKAEIGGETVLDAFAMFYPSTPQDVRVGEDPLSASSADGPLSGAGATVGHLLAGAQRRH